MRIELKKRLGDLLVENKVITSEQLNKALEAQQAHGRRLGQTLVNLEFISEIQLAKFLAQQLDLPFINLNQKYIDIETVLRLPEVQARRYRALVTEYNPNTVLVALSDPSDIQAQDHIEHFFHPLSVQYSVATETELNDAIENLYRKTEEITSMAGQLEQEHGLFDHLQLTTIQAGDEQTTVVKLLNTLFEDAMQVRASDIHIEPDEDCLRIRHRVDGDLQEMIIQEVSIARALSLRIKLMANLDISEKRLPQDGRFNIQLNDKMIDVRVSILPIQQGEAIVMRLLDRSTGLLDLHQTGAPSAVLARIHKHINQLHGMVLVTGPTGSGKTTSLYGMLNTLNTSHKKIISIEDPIEYQLPRINQVQVHPKIGLTFANTLRTVLRHDPDVIMIGEMRDQETAEIGLRAAITGHLVFSTLHTNDAISTILRLLDMGAEPYLIASALRLIVAQRLLKKNCLACLKVYKPTPAEEAWLTQYQVHFTDKLKHSPGCQKCSGTGYYGRLGVFELLEMNEAMMIALRTHTPQKFIDAARESPGFIPLAHSALEYLQQGLTTIEEVRRLIEGLHIEQIQRK
jgi:MSHA biogenesis protein MshE